MKPGGLLLLYRFRLPDTALQKKEGGGGLKVVAKGGEMVLYEKEDVDEMTKER